MLALLLPIAIATGLQEGDTWVSELTIRYVQQSEGIDFKRQSRLAFHVITVTTESTTIRVDSTPLPADATKPVQETFVFSPGGALLSSEITANQDLARVHRMEWTAAEPKQAISWARSWPTRSDLIEAKVTVRPTARTTKDATMRITYLESGKQKGAATAKLITGLPIIEDFEASLNDSIVPGAKKPGVVMVSERLKEIHLQQ